MKFQSKNEKDMEAAIGKQNLLRLNPMVIPMLSVKISESTKNDFLISSRDAILNRPHKLTEKWINSLNKWVDEAIKAAMLDEPQLSVGQRHKIGPLKVDKISPNHDGSETPVVICSDDSGWKWHLRTSKGYEFNIGDSIIFVAMVVVHKDGITFLSRPSKIEIVK